MFGCLREPDGNAITTRFRKFDFPILTPGLSSMKKLVLLAAAALIATTAPALAQKKKPAAPQGTQRIAAVVNDDVISIRDLIARLKVIIVTSGVPDSLETRKRLAPQVLRTLIDETLQVQEARRLNVKVTKAEVETAWKGLEKQNKMPPGGLERFLRQKKIPKETIERQMHAAILWSKVVRQRVRPRIRIGDEEVSDVIEQIEAGASLDQYRFLEIYLPVDNPDQEKQVLDNANRMAAQIRRGANFQVLARQFSKSETSRVGGDTGYVSSAQINPDLLKALEKMRPRTMAGPIKTVTGYYILALLDRRRQGSTGKAATVAWRAVSFDAGGEEAKAAAAEREAKALAASAKSCADLGSLAKKHGGKAGPIQKSTVSKLTGDAGIALKTLGKNAVSAPLKSGDKVQVLMVCERTKGGNTPSRAQILNVLAREQINIQVRRYMRDLRQGAFVDIRV